MGPGHFDTHGDPNSWKYLGKKTEPATEIGREAGSKKVYEVYLARTVSKSSGTIGETLMARLMAGSEISRHDKPQPSCGLNSERQNSNQAFQGIKKVVRYV